MDVFKTLLLDTPATLANVSGVLPIVNGGTNASTAADARTNLGLGTAAVVNLGTGVATFLATPSSANLAAALTDETGTGAAVFATSPVLVTPALGTPSALVGTNISGTAAALTAGNVTTNANLTGDVTSVGNATTLTNAPVIAKVLTGYTSGAGTVAATDSILQAIQKLNGNDATNANLTGVITSVGNATSIASQTGTGTKFVVDTSPVLVTPNLGTPTAAVLTSATGLPLTTGVTGTLPAANGGTGVANNAAMTVTGSGNFAYTRTLTGATNVTFPTTGTLATLAGSETLTNKTLTSPTLTTPALGTPASGVVTNLTGTASININGTVGATTANTGAFTTISASGAATLSSSLYVSGVSQFIGTGAAPGTGSGVELRGGANPAVTAYNRTGSAYLPIALDGLTSALAVSGSAIATASSTGFAVTGAITATGSITPSQTAGIVGTTTNNSANAGSVGEYVESVVLVGSAISLTTGTQTDITSISLTAGDWDVTGRVSFNPGATTTTTFLIGFINTAPTSYLETAANVFNAPLPAGVLDTRMPLGTLRINVSTTTTAYLTCNSSFAVSTLKGYGMIRARRVR